MLKILSAIVALCVYGFASCNSTFIQNTIKSVKSELPMKVDAYTSINGIDCKKNYLIYNYKLNDTKSIKFNELTNEQKNIILKTMRSHIKNSCSDLKEGFGDKIFGIKYRYFLEDKTLFGEVGLNFNECK